MTREQFEWARRPRNALLVGSPQEVIDKILFEHEIFGHDRFLAQLTVGAVPHDKVLRAIELLGTVVAPAVLKEVARRKELAHVAVQVIAQRDGGHLAIHARSSLESRQQRGGEDPAHHAVRHRSLTRQP